MMFARIVGQNLVMRVVVSSATTADGRDADKKNLPEFILGLVCVQKKEEIEGLR